VDTIGAQRPHGALDAAAPLQLVRAAAALRWKRPDLTVTLAELALDAADDAATWVGAAGWLLHGRALLGDGRQVACDLLDGLARWGDAGVELMGGPHGRRLRIELAGPARRTGERAAARALLAADPGVDALDAELQADVLSELARCAADEAPDDADPALDAAEQAWGAAGCEPGVASVLLVRAARDRRAGRVDAAVTAAVAGLARVNAGGRRAGDTASDHLAAALTAEWIAALVDAGRLDEARSDALPAAHRLITLTRPSRQLAGLRLAVARVAAVSKGSGGSETAGTVLAALEPAAQVAADSDVPELESACRSMLGELHEAAGRLDAALGAVRAAMAAERCDHDRGARLRTALAAATATWAGRPTGHEVERPSVLPDAAPPPVTVDAEPGRAEGSAAPAEPRPDTVPPDLSSAPPAASDEGARARLRARNWNGATGPGRRARRLAAEAAADQGWSDAPLPELGTRTANRPSRDPEPWAAHSAAGPVAGPPARTTDTGRAVAVGSPSLIGDALLRELIENAGTHGAPAEDPRPSTSIASTVPADRPADAADTVVFELDRRHDPTMAVAPLHPARDAADGDAAERRLPGRPSGPGQPPGPGPHSDPSSAARRATGPDPGDGRGGPVGSATVQVGTPVEPTGAGAPRPGRNGHGGPGNPGDRPRAGEQHPPGSVPQAPASEQARQPDGAGRPRATDTDGLGIGDLLAGALAAYRGI
jgi:hypothetical protein